jgi:hypothetical protein
MKITQIQWGKRNKIHVSLLFLLMSCGRVQGQQTYDPFLWAKSPTSALNADFGTSICNYPNSNNGYIYAAGIFTGSITFGSTTLTSAGDEDVYIVCYDNCLNTVRWATSIGGSWKDNTDLNTVAISARGGQLVVTGSVNRDASVTFNGNNGTSLTLAAAPGNGNDIFVAQYQYDNGNLHWARTYGSAGSGEETGTAIEGTTSGQGLVVTGRFYRTVDFGPNALGNPINITSAGGSDIFVLRILTLGSTFSNPVYVAQIGGTQDDIGLDIATQGTAGSGNIDVYVSGIYGEGGGSADIYQPYNNNPVGPQVFYNTSTTSRQGHGAFVGRINTGGTWSWFNSIPVIGTASGITGVNAYLDYDYFDNRIYVAGNFDDDITAEDAVSSNITLIPAAAGNNDVYVTSYDPAGTFYWGSQAQNITNTHNSDETVSGINHDYSFGSGGFKVSGTFTGTTTFGSLNLTSAGGTDIYVCQVNETNGDVLDLWRAGAGGNETVGGMDTDWGRGNNAFLTGKFATNTLIGTTALSGSKIESYYTSFTSERLAIVNNGSPTLPGGSTPPNLGVTMPTKFSNYQWYFNGYPLATAPSTANHSPAAKGVYFVEAKDVYCSGYTYRSNTISIGEDCASSGLSTTYPADYTFTTNMTVTGEILGGDITIDPGVTVDFSGGQILMLPGSTIRVRAGATLNINLCTLSSCEQWKGIIVENGGTLNVNTSTIRDAVVAIYSEAPITVYYGTFSFNKVSIALKNTSAPSSITQSHFDNMYVAEPWCAVGTSDPIYPYIAANHHIDIRNCSGADDISDNEFVGVPGATFDIFPAIMNVAAIYEAGSSNTVIDENDFINNMGYGVYATLSHDVIIQHLNHFYGQVLNGIGVFDCGKVTIGQNNMFTSNVLHGIHAENSENLTVHANLFDYTNAIYLKGVIPYFIYANQIYDCSYGVESYIDDYPANYRTTPPKCVISSNEFRDCAHATVIAPKLNPYTNSTAQPNTMIPGQSIQYVLLSCNIFTNSTWAIGVSGQLIDQYASALDPGNTFNFSSEWDIITNSSPAFTYYYYVNMPNNVGCLMNPLVFDGVTLSTSSINLSMASGTYGDCGYTPFTPIVLASPEKDENKALCKAYPNPAGKTLTIEGAQQGSSYVLTDATGRFISKGIMEAGPTVLDVHELTDGFYLIKIEDNQRMVHTIRFVKAD